MFFAVYPPLIKHIAFAVIALCHALTAANAADATPDDLAARYFELLEHSRASQPQPYNTTGFTSVTPLRKHNANGSMSYANASLLRAGTCHLIYATSAHALMDNSYRFRMLPDQIEIRGRNGEWLPALQLVTSEQTPRRNEESTDWGLLVLKLPECDGEHYAALTSDAIDGDTLKHCHEAVEMTCFQFQRGEPTLVREQHCALISEFREVPGDPHHIGYISCDQREGVSGCAPVCRHNGAARALGVFNYGLRAQHSGEEDQQVGVFRGLDGEFHTALTALAARYDLP